MTINKMLFTFFITLCIPVLSVLYIGLLLSALLAILAGILRTFGFEQIKMSIWNGVDLPYVLSIPFSLAVFVLLIFLSIYVKRSIKYCLSHYR